VDGEYRGLPNGLHYVQDFNGNAAISQFSRIGNFWRCDGAATPSAIMTYSEVLFLEAEAAERGWIAANAATLYADAIRADMRQWDPWGPAHAPSDAQAEAYLAQPRVAYQGGAAGLAQIQLQKWIALYTQGDEAWANWRRTKIPDLQPGPYEAQRLGRIPARWPYPAKEQSLNNDNLQAALTRQGGGLDLVTPLWWEKH